ncbi:MAG: hypothetical protein IH933_09365 [Euryarchaeota archaeon]|jgi:hypothetical protein|nr:hypothetical protein [Euryarchaeota archaeon]
MEIGIVLVGPNGPIPSIGYCADHRASHTLLVNEQDALACSIGDVLQNSTCLDPDAEISTATRNNEHDRVTCASKFEARVSELIAEEHTLFERYQ